MRYIAQHIKTIIETYTGDIPLAHFLKNYFRQYPILGSRDRKLVSALAYSWHRINKGIADKEWLDGLLAQWLNDKESQHNKEWLNDAIAQLPYHETFHLDALFPFDIALSGGIGREEWLRSMLVQPHLFIRIRRDKGKIISLLNGQQVPFTFINDTCLSLPNGAKIDTLLPPDSYVVQDASSQQTGTFFNPHKNESWYDCCSGAGGKSLLLKDLEPGVRLTISDKRESIIHNLQQRFRQYRHQLPIACVIDVTSSQSLDKALGSKLYDNIICDAPCSGSGTWGRTPEQMYFFKPASLPTFTILQQTIAINVSRHLKPGGRLIYITCSVFKEENERVVEEIIKQTSLKLIQSQVINGISIGADSMFVAVLT